MWPYESKHMPMCMSSWDPVHACWSPCVTVLMILCRTSYHPIQSHVPMYAHKSMAASTQYCIGYMPVVSDLGAQFVSTELKFHVRNKCIESILRVLESAARSGVRCRLPCRDEANNEMEMILMPRLFSMNLDQPEAQLYFGMLNRTCVYLCSVLTSSYACTHMNLYCNSYDLMWLYVGSHDGLHVIIGHAVNVNGVKVGVLSEKMPQDKLQPR